MKIDSRLSYDEVIAMDPMDRVRWHANRDPFVPRHPSWDDKTDEDYARDIGLYDESGLRGAWQRLTLTQAHVIGLGILLIPALLWLHRLLPWLF